MMTAEVIHFWEAMIASKPSTPRPTTMASITSSTATMKPVPACRPSRSATVAVDSTASEVRTISQPTTSK